jgi:hypothetical protein
MKTGIGGRERRRERITNRDSLNRPPFSSPLSSTERGSLRQQPPTLVAASDACRSLRRLSQPPTLGVDNSLEKWAMRTFFAPTLVLSLRHEVRFRYCRSSAQSGSIRRCLELLTISWRGTRTISRTAAMGGNSCCEAGMTAGSIESGYARACLGSRYPYMPTASHATMST